MSELPSEDDVLDGYLPPTSPLMDLDEFGALLGVKRQRAYAMALDGLIPVVRLGRRIYVPRSFLDVAADEAIRAWQRERTTP